MEPGSFAEPGTFEVWKLYAEPWGTWTLIWKLRGTWNLWSVEALCGTLGNLNLDLEALWNGDLYLEPLWNQEPLWNLEPFKYQTEPLWNLEASRNLEPWKCGSFMRNLGEPEPWSGSFVEPGTFIWNPCGTRNPCGTWNLLGIKRNLCGTWKLCGTWNLWSVEALLPSGPTRSQWDIELMRSFRSSTKETACNKKSKILILSFKFQTDHW